MPSDEPASDGGGGKTGSPRRQGGSGGGGKADDFGGEADVCLLVVCSCPGETGGEAGFGWGGGDAGVGWGGGGGRLPMRRSWMMSASNSPAEWSTASP